MHKGIGAELYRGTTLLPAKAKPFAAHKFLCIGRTRPHFRAKRRSARGAREPCWAEAFPAGLAPSPARYGPYPCLLFPSLRGYSFLDIL